MQLTHSPQFFCVQRINSLLFAEDTDIIIAALQLLLKPSQQYSSQPSASQTLHVSNKRLITLASRWPGLRENTVDFIDLLAPPKDGEGKDKTEVPAEAAQVNYTFYRRSNATTNPTESEEKEVVQERPEPVSPTRAVRPSLVSTPSTPAPTAPSASAPITSAPFTTEPESNAGGGMITIHIPSTTILSPTLRPIDILIKQIEKYNIPEEERFELLHRIRCARSLSAEGGKEEEKMKERVNLVVIRLLAVAIFGEFSAF